MKSAIDRLIACYAERLQSEPFSEREDLLVALQILTNVEEDLL